MNFLLLTGALAALATPARGNDAAHPGEASYRTICFVCHDKGAYVPPVGAPRLGDRSAWQSRAQKGIDFLHKKITAEMPNGFRMPMGNLTDEEIKAAIDFMLANGE